MSKSSVRRREFLKAASVAGASAAALNAPAGLSAAAGAEPGAAPEVPPETKFPKLAIITRYSPSKLRFAASAGYEGVVIPLDDFFDPDKLQDNQIDAILNSARDAGVRIISIECMWGMNHIAKDPAEREKAQARFIRCLEFGHRLRCKFVGTFSGYQAGTPMEDQAKDLAAVFNETYLPVCERLDLGTGWENYPCNQNFARRPERHRDVHSLQHGSTAKASR